MEAASATPLVVLVSLVAGIGTDDKAPAASKPAAVNVSVRLTEWRIRPSVDHVCAGRVTFSARNSGKLEHELVVIRTNRLPADLPLEKNDEAGEVGGQGEVEGLKPARTGRITLARKPGRYVLLCNESDHGGHYEHGMFAALTVR